MKDSSTIEDPQTATPYHSPTSDSPIQCPLTALNLFTIQPERRCISPIPIGLSSNNPNITEPAAFKARLDQPDFLNKNLSPLRLTRPIVHQPKIKVSSSHRMQKQNQSLHVMSEGTRQNSAFCPTQPSETRISSQPYHCHPSNTPPISQQPSSYIPRSVPKEVEQPTVIDNVSARLTPSTSKFLASNISPLISLSTSVTSGPVNHRPYKSVGPSSHYFEPSTASVIRSSHSPSLIKTAVSPEQQHTSTTRTTYVLNEPLKNDVKQMAMPMNGAQVTNVSSAAYTPQVSCAKPIEGLGFRSYGERGAPEFPTSVPITASLGRRRYENVPLIAQDSFNEVKSVVHNYEKLLAVERQNHECILLARDQKIHTLTNELQMTMKGNSKENDLQTLLRTREDELKILFKSRDQQIEALEKKLEAEEELRRHLKVIISETQPACEIASQPEIQRLKRVIEHLDTQLRQAKVVASTRQEQYQALLKDLAVKETLIRSYKPYHPEDIHLQASANKTAEQLDYLESEVTAMRQIIDELMFEKKELQQILIQRDKQIACMSSLDPTMSDASAVQLSVQAISMVQSTVQLKDHIRKIEEELLSVQEKYEDCKEKFEDTHKKLTEKRQEAAGLVETLAQRDMRIALLDTLLQHRDKESSQLKEESKVLLGKEREKYSHLEMEIRIAIDQQSRLREELSLRDAHVLDLKNEVIRQSRFNEISEDRVQILSNELKEAEKHLQKLIRQNVAKDRYMLELEKRMKDHDVRRQATYLNEVAKNRKLQLDIRLREDDARHALYDKEEQIANLKTELFSSAKHADVVKSLLISATSLHPAGPVNVEGLGDSDRVTEVIQSTGAKRRPARENKYPNGDAHISDDKNPVFHSLEPQTQRSDNNTLDKVTPLVSVNEDPSSIYGDSDMVNLLLHETLRKKKYRSIRAFFCRVGRGKYLFGRHKVAFRISSKGSLEAQIDPNVDYWIPFVSFVTAMEARVALDSKPGLSHIL